MSLSRIAVLLLVLCACLVLLACGGEGSTSMPTPSPTPSPTPARVTLAPFVSGLNAPVNLQEPKDGTGRIFVVDLHGTIGIVSGSSILPTKFLDISDKVVIGGELGLLSMAFHPAYNENGRFFVFYIRLQEGVVQSVIAEYRVSETDPNVADPASEHIIMVVDQPDANHKGGQLAFGPDGYLYLGLGDGGGQGDPDESAQNMNLLLGKMLRIDVNQTSAGLEYAIPADNPFVNGGGRGEIWAVGFRNPWRFSIDEPTGRVFVGDVGQDRFEEFDLVTRGGNYGWDKMEGSHCFEPMTGCDTTGLTPPIFEYDRSQGNSAIGGFVYRGTAVNGLQGTYVCGDLLGGKIWGLTEGPSGTWSSRVLITHNRQISAFGRDDAGELYVIDFGNREILKIVAEQ